MGLSLGSDAGRRTVLLADAALVVWIVAWAWLGVAIHRDVQDLRQLSDTVVNAGNAVQATGRALHSLEQLPFVGGRIADLERQIQSSGARAVASGIDSRASIDHLSVLLGVGVGVVPSAPLLLAYVPFRVARAREVRTIKRAVRRGSDPAVDEFLARRAAAHLPYRVLRRISSNPWRDLESGRFDALARAELRRLGVRQPGRADGTGPGLGAGVGRGSWASG